MTAMICSGCMITITAPGNVQSRCWLSPERMDTGGELMAKIRGMEAKNSPRLFFSNLWLLQMLKKKKEKEEETLKNPKSEHMDDEYQAGPTECQLLLEKQKQILETSARSVEVPASSNVASPASAATSRIWGTNEAKRGLARGIGTQKRKESRRRETGGLTSSPQSSPTLVSSPRPQCC